jgi:serine/threonine protein kinase
LQPVDPDETIAGNLTHSAVAAQSAAVDDETVVGSAFPPVRNVGADVLTPPHSSSQTSQAPTVYGEKGLVDFGPRYRVIRLLGEGGMGAVYLAYDQDLGRQVALKLVKPELMVYPGAMERFRQELLLASKISHRNVLRIHDLGDAGGMKFISMAYVDGEDLHQVLVREGRLPLDRMLNISRQLCAALDAAHSEGVAHRDLKPQNIMLAKDGHVYVTDFGLAKSLGAADGMTQSGEMLGTPRVTWLPSR